jgi:hypothetical protein
MCYSNVVTVLAFDRPRALQCIKKKGVGKALTILYIQVSKTHISFLRNTNPEQLSLPLLIQMTVPLTCLWSLSW